LDSRLAGKTGEGRKGKPAQAPSQKPTPKSKTRGRGIQVSGMDRAGRKYKGHTTGGKAAVP